MRSNQHRWVHYLIVASLIATTGWPAWGQVLCVGQDGHRAIELPHAGSGCEQAHSDSRNGDSHVAVEAAQSGCVDFALAIDDPSSHRRVGGAIGHGAYRVPLAPTIGNPAYGHSLVALQVLRHQRRANLLDVTLRCTILVI